MEFIQQKPKFVKFTSTDGELVVNVNHVIAVIGDPEDEGTCMMHVERGSMNVTEFKVSGSITEILERLTA